MLGVVVDGADTLAASLRAAGDQLEDLTGVNTTAGQAVLGAARIPRDTGTLAASVTADPTPLGVTFTATARHAPFVHWGTRHLRARPFLSDALTAREAAVVDLYTAHTADTLNQIEA